MDPMLLMGGAFAALALVALLFASRRHRGGAGDGGSGFVGSDGSCDAGSDGGGCDGGGGGD